MHESLIKTSEAVRVVMSLDARYGSTKTPDRKGETITETSFGLGRTPDEIIRFVVRDAAGREAFTRAYRVGDIYKRAGMEI